MSYSKRILLFLFTMTLSFAGMAQEKVDMADQMRSNGRIYVVVAVMVTILLGLVLYLVRIDRRLSKLEKENRL